MYVCMYVCVLYCALSLYLSLSLCGILNIQDFYSSHIGGYFTEWVPFASKTPF